MEEKQNDKRMLEIMKSLDNPRINKKEISHTSDSSKLLSESEKMINLATGRKNEMFHENYYAAGSYGAGGQGKTVTTFQDSQIPDSSQSAKAEPSGLKPEEALLISLQRVIKSGAPINNISFYDEINWNLMNLGFPAVDAIKIKESIGSMLSE